jgi:hypothetical protein
MWMCGKWRRRCTWNSLGCKLSPEPKKSPNTRNLKNCADFDSSTRKTWRTVVFAKGRKPFEDGGKSEL